MEAAGWSVARLGKRRVRVTRAKSHGTLLEDRVWSVLFALGFPKMSGPAGASIGSSDSKLSNQIDVLAIDDEIVLAVECKSSQAVARRYNLQQELAKLSALRQNLAKAVNPRGLAKHTVVLAFFTHNAVLSDTDRARAAQLGIALFDNEDLAYYEALASHLGPAARYQFLADLIPGKVIPGLKIRVPAVRSKMLGHRCYAFSVAPEYLLKIAFVSHRAKGKAADINAYQRMINKNRLRDIRQYIRDRGVFPTNIVLNVESQGRSILQFERVQQEDSTFGSVGWLTISPAYKAAWVIDGQHRLFAFSGLPEASSGLLSVLAFDGLPPSQQAQLFIDINAKQKSVKQNLLRELYAELHWDSSDPEARTAAIISKTVQALGLERGSPLYGRILLADNLRTAIRCVSLTSVFSALERPGFFYRTIRKQTIVDPGPFWAKDGASSLKRASTILAAWLTWVEDGASGWWNLGSDPGGGLAMNDGITICIGVLRSVVDHLDTGRTKLSGLTSAEALDRLKPFGLIFGQYLGSLNADQRRAFRSLRGVQGQTTGIRRAQQAIHEARHEFDPPGLTQFMEQEKAQTTTRGAATIDEIERMLQGHVIDQLKLEFQIKPDDWWYEGVPAGVRTKAAERREEDKNQRGGPEKYLDLIDYRSIAIENWAIFQETLGRGKSSASKATRTDWIVSANDLRRKVMHASSGVLLTSDQLAMLEEARDWLKSQLNNNNTDGPRPGVRGGGADD
jgi:DNA sulfur modification protein DndB